MVAECAKTADLNTAKSNFLSYHYKMDSNDQYQRRENVRVGNFSPSGDLTKAVVQLLNHMIDCGTDSDIPAEDSESQSLFASQSDSTGTSKKTTDLKPCLKM